MIFATVLPNEDCKGVGDMVDAPKTIFARATSATRVAMSHELVSRGSRSRRGESDAAGLSTGSSDLSPYVWIGFRRPLALVVGLLHLARSCAVPMTVDLARTAGPCAPSKRVASVMCITRGLDKNPGPRRTA